MVGEHPVFVRQQMELEIKRATRKQKKHKKKEPKATLAPEQSLAFTQELRFHGGSEVLQPPSFHTIEEEPQELDQTAFHPELDQTAFHQDEPEDFDQTAVSICLWLFGVLSSQVKLLE